MPFGGVFAVLGIGYAAAVAFFLARGWKPGARSAAFILLGAIVLGSPLLLETDNLALRVVVGGLLPMIFLPHMWDLHLDPARGNRLSLRAYVVFVGNYAWSVARVAGGYGQDLSFPRRLLDAGRYVAGLGVVTLVTVGVFQVPWAAYPFLVEHAVKSTSVTAWALWAFQANTALWRLAGAPAAFFTTGNVLGACRPADFWRRWNRPMYRWLLENVYRPLGGHRNPPWAVLGTFAVSGLMHEYLFTVTFQRVTGYPTAFFLLHGLVVVLTRRLRPLGALVLPAAVFTFAFNTVSTLLLFIPLHERVRFYVNDVPPWLPWW
jgi:hypothetical protein